MKEKLKDFLQSCIKNTMLFSINRVQHNLEIGFMRAMKLKEILIDCEIINSKGELIVSNDKLDKINFDEIYKKLYVL